MAQADIVVQPTKYKLLLTEEEAKFIRNITQNPLCPIEQESQQEGDIRHSIFSALNEVL